MVKVKENRDRMKMWGNKRFQQEEKKREKGRRNIQTQKTVEKNENIQITDRCEDGIIVNYQYRR